MKVPKYYLAHPLHYHVAVRVWELDFKRDRNIEFLNPFYSNDCNNLNELELKAKREKMNMELGRKIMDRDLNMINESDGVIGFIESNCNSIGTGMEIFYNSRILRKPTYIISKDFEDHPWIKALASRIFRNKSDFERFYDHE